MGNPSPRPRGSLRLGFIAASAAMVVGIGFGAFTLGAAQAAAPKATVPKAKPRHGDVTLKRGFAADTKTKTDAEVEIFCRGPFQLSAGGFATVRARKGNEVAGNFGDPLVAGRCALRDRLLSGTERAEIILGRSGADVAPTVMSLLSVCAMDEDCVLLARVRPANSGYFQLSGNEVEIWKHGRNPAVNF